MELFIDNWFVLLAFVAAMALTGVLVYTFIKMPTSKQLDKVREWLVFACIQAEIQLGNGTGKVKLRSVYDSFLTKFPWLAKVVSFETFSAMVDEALITVREMLELNTAIRNLVVMEVKDNA
ncbi:hypothetical protein [Sporosarcina sp. FSL W7-1283]|uniref:hypothetical protein n=1 Tax=Sporosarcina sp. FSL W7-1283 TaxID=2921560 RepID=UPI0030F6CAB9